MNVGNIFYVKLEMLYDTNKGEDMKETFTESIRWDSTKILEHSPHLMDRKFCPNCLFGPKR